MPAPCRREASGWPIVLVGVDVGDLGVTEDNCAVLHIMEEIWVWAWDPVFHRGLVGWLVGCFKWFRYPSYIPLFLGSSRVVFRLFICYYKRCYLPFDHSIPKILALEYVFPAKSYLILHDAFLDCLSLRCFDGSCCLSSE